MTNEIEKNMLRPRAKKLPEVTDEMWNKVNLEYKQLTKEFIKNQGLSPKSQIQYESIIRQFGWFMHTQLRDKPFYKITKRDFLNYLSYLREDRNMSSSAINARKSTISSFSNYIENIIVGDEDFENYSNFRNFTRGLPPIPKSQTYEKVKVTRNEYLFMMEELEKKENYLGMAWLATAFNVGARRSEIIQFKTEILKDEFPSDSPHIMSHTVRGKGRGIDGKPIQYMINEEAYSYMKLWVEKRGYEDKYIFTTRYDGQYKVMDESWADYFCSNVLSEMLGRRINVHIFKASAITNLLESGVPIALVSKFVAQHEDVAVTMKHYDLREFEDEKNTIFAALMPKQEEQ